jgi:Chaperone of endosialidase
MQQPGTLSSAVRGEDRLVRMVQDLAREVKELRAALPHTHPGDQVTTPVAEANGSSYAWNNVVAGTTTYAVQVGNDGGFHFGRPTSSIRYKYNVREHYTDPANILSLTPVVYDRLPVEVTRPDGTTTWTIGREDEYGLIAEEVYEKFPELVTWFDGQIDGIRYELLAVALLEVVKDQDLRIKALEDMALEANAAKAQTGGKYKAPIRRQKRPNLVPEAVVEPPLPYTINPADWVKLTPEEEEEILEEAKAPELQTPPADNPQPPSESA